MAANNECPFCGNNSISSFSSYQDLIETGIGEFPQIQTPDGPIRISSNPRPKNFHKCCSCLMEYSFTDIDIEDIISNSRAVREISFLLNHYYPNGPSIFELIREYRTATLKKPSHTSSYLADDEVNRMIIIPFNYQGIRTYATFMREKSSNNYLITGLVRSGL